MTTFRTPQEIFDLVWNGLKAQGFKQSLGVGQNCAYRGVDGMKCAIGHCIDDGDYCETLEGKSAEDHPVLKAARINPETDIYFADALQRAHDESVHPETMKYRLRGLANDFNLTVPA